MQPRGSGLAAGQCRHTGGFLALTSIRVACMQDGMLRGVQQKRAKLNASITRQPCASRFRDNSLVSAQSLRMPICPSLFLLDFDHHKVSKIEI